MLRSRRRTWVIGTTASLAGSVLLYKLYHSKRLALAWHQYIRFTEAVSSYNQAFLAGADISAAISKDLQFFLQSDSRELPQSLRQVAQLLQAEETQAATSSLAAATVRGIVTATHDAGGSSFSGIEKLLSALSSRQGHSLVTLAVSVAARTSTQTYCECVERSAAAAKASEEATGILADTLVQQVLRFACTPEGERLCMLGVKNFVTNATAVYCQNLEGVSMWQDLFSAMVKPEHKQVAAHLTRCFINELTNTLRKPAPPMSMEPPSSSHTFSNSGLCEQHQQPGNAQSSGQAHSVSSKPFGQGGRRADAKAPSPVTLQAHTGVLPFLGNAQPPADVPAQSQQQSWWQHQGSAVVQEAVKVLWIPEGRMMLLSLSAIAVAEGIQTGYHGVKEACLDDMGTLQQMPLSEGGKFMGMSLRQLYAALSIVVMLMLYINGQRASLHHA